MNGFVAFLRSFGVGRVAALLAVAIALIGFFAFTIIRFSQPAMTPLFSDLSPEDASAIVKELDQQNVPYELRQNGAGILVPQDQAAKLRMKMAEARLPSGGGVGWEIFDKGDGFSATSFVQNVNHLRALEGELARSIRSLNRVEAARVHLVIPERPLFTRDAPQPSASIVIRSRGELETGEIRAIRHLAASAVQGLKPEKVSLVDEAGRLLADGSDSESGAGAGDDRVTNLERRLRERVEAIVGRVVGADRARVEVRAEMDNTKSTVTADNFDPESRVVRSTQTREESSQTSEPAEQGVSVGNQLPNAAANAASAAQNRDQSNKTEEVVNYEISRTTRTEVKDAGQLKRLSVAVLVDGVYTRAANGDVSYAPRAQAELDQIGALVRAGVGFDQGRGDTVEVVNLRFADLPQAGSAGEPESPFAFSREDMMRWAELGVLALLTLVVTLVVVRPLLRKALSPEGDETPALAGAAAGAGLAPIALGADGTPSLAGPDQPALAGPAGAGVVPAAAGGPAPANMIAAAEIAGRVQQESVQRIGDLVRGNPNETVSIIRQWMQEPA
ncbi:flagellar M-ring protein [Methylopila jiangsuensis]|uniref:Flagellar M-ring protein n=1 Tax=Methylopila jiangsuensis TaxID=586230 RepID=A0A9W6JI94_9HYPH|nr:flagellar basal-body MS-ring/collar protein FliF [Methylopila jiangsuensis]MDR6284158.1 flagellar M-ring protein FliF [Methylopila jiangsuensis]GLK76325.1 flagellar M-ring protein [Methylopila jiangsuensis]